VCESMCIWMKKWTTFFYRDTTYVRYSVWECKSALSFTTYIDGDSTKDFEWKFACDSFMDHRFIDTLSSSLYKEERKRDGFRYFCTKLCINFPRSLCAWYFSRSLEMTIVPTFVQLFSSLVKKAKPKLSCSNHKVLFIYS